MAFKTQVQTILGGIYRYALFYNFPGGLRFELSAGDSPLDQAFYDDRGMDVIARDAAVLTGLYQQHHALLFDYDIDAMRLTYEPLTN